MTLDAIERAIRLLEDGEISNLPLSTEDADAILESRLTLEGLVGERRVNAAALQLFVEFALAKLGVSFNPSDPLKTLLERLRRELRNATLAKVAPEPLELWNSSLVRRGLQLLGRETLSK